MTLTARLTVVPGSHTMGVWLMLPQAEEVIAARCTFGKQIRRGGKVRTRGGKRGGTANYDMHVCRGDGVANLDDLKDMDVPMWECEIPLTDDGF